MGSLNLAYPSIAGKTTGEQLESVRRYLCTLTERLNLADWSAGAVLQEVSRAIDADSLPDAERKMQLGNFGQLKALIIKTADYAAANSQEFQTKLSGNYVAVSDFGKYWQEATMTIDGNEFGIRQLYDYAAGINNDYTVKSQQYVKTGLLYYDGATPVYGVGVGNIETTVSSGNTVIDKTKNELVTVTPGRMSFWQNGSEVAYLTDKKLHFPSGTLEATNAVLSGTLTAASGSKIGPWTVSDSSIYRTYNTWGASGGLYFGTSGLSLGNNFKVDANGNLTASGASISGAITASSLYVGGNEIATQLNYLTQTVYTQLSALMNYVDAYGGYGGNLTGNTVTIGGGYGYLYAGTNTAGTTAFEVRGTTGLRLTSAGNVYIGAQGGGTDGSITIGGGMVSIYAASGLYVNGTKVV